ncbi:excitatory amino acid transporter-like [Ornithodoros turicata]|uniref:excitatory amino acid transporter-like n=1 Tax=Ornithodoros turicata TaxID=34597 RepID=UPI003139EFEB
MAILRGAEEEDEGTCDHEPHVNTRGRRVQELPGLTAGTDVELVKLCPPSTESDCFIWAVSFRTCFREPYQGTISSMKPLLPAPTPASVLDLLYADEVAQESGSAVLVNNLLLVLLTSSVLAGFGLGQVTRQSEGQWTTKQIMLVGLPAELFLRLASLLVLPLIMASVIASVSTSERSWLGKLGRNCALYFVVTKVLAAGSAIAFTALIMPGKPLIRMSKDSITLKRRTEACVDIFLEILRNALPINIVESCLFTVTVVNPPANTSSNGTELDNLATIQRTALTNYLGLVVFCIIVGAVLSTVPLEQRVMTDIFVCLSEAMKSLTYFSLWYFPIGICFMITVQILLSNEFFRRLDDSPDSITLRSYIFTMLLCQGFHLMVTLPLMLYFFGKRRYTGLYANLGFIIVTAFGSSSSNATVPITMFTLERKMGMDPSMVGIVSSIGSCVNFDGLIIHRIVTLLYYAQQTNMVLSLIDYVYISMYVVLRSLQVVGKAGGLEDQVICDLLVLGIPAKSTMDVFITEWLLDRCMTVVNVMGDVVACSVLDNSVMKGEEKCVL